MVYFAVFSMLRYRTEGISTKDMTYLFMVIAIGLISAISKDSWEELLFTTIILLLITALLEGSWLIKKEHTKVAIYDKIGLISPTNRELLIEDLSARTGLNIHRVEIQDYDFLKDSVTIDYVLLRKITMKISSFRPFIILLLLTFTFNQLYAQNEGLALWNSISVEKKITKKLSVSLSGQARIVENISYAQTYLGEVGLSYKFLKNFEISGNYRYTERRKNENIKTFKSRHRFYADLSYEQKLGFLKFENRLRYQSQFKDNDGGNRF